MSIDPELAFEKRDYSGWSNQRSSPCLVQSRGQVGSTVYLKPTDKEILLPHRQPMRVISTHSPTRVESGNPILTAYDQSSPILHIS
ncbi:hypothetical protein EON65_03090 [archaeon]|nr:MAG: hypothetical protein EON65_03090 [archaeon]